MIYSINSIRYYDFLISYIPEKITSNTRYNNFYQNYNDDFD